MVKRLLLSVVAIPTAIIGLIPAIIWGANNSWANVTFVRSLGGTWTLQRVVVSLNASVVYSTCIAPHIVSGAIPTENTMLVILHLLPLCTGMAYIGISLVMLATSFFRSGPLLTQARQLLGLPTLFAACAVVTFCISSVAVFALLGCAYDATGRYATPLMLALPFFFAAAYVLTRQYLDESERSSRVGRPQGSPLPSAIGDGGTIGAARDENDDIARDENDDIAQSVGRPLRSPLPSSSSGGEGNDVEHSARAGEIGRPQGSPLPSSRASNAALGRAILLGVLLLYFGVQVASYALTDPRGTFQSNYCTIDPASDASIIAYMQREHISYFWASNLLAYPIVFETNSHIIGVDPTPIMHPKNAINRIPAYTEAVRHADRPSLMVMIKANDPHPILLQLLDAQHVTYQEAIFPSSPGYNLLLVTPLSRTVSPFEKGFDIFYCYPATHSS